MKKIDSLEYAKRRALRLREEGDYVGAGAIEDVCNELEFRRRVSVCKELTQENEEMGFYEE